MSTPQKHDRGVIYRLIPGICTKAGWLWQICGACRSVWNPFLGKNRDEYQQWKDGERASKPSVSFFALGKSFTPCRRETPWLRDLPCKPVRHLLKHQAEAWQKTFKENAGFPKFTCRHKSRPSLMIPENVKVRGSKLTIPKVGWMVIGRRGGSPYPDGKVKQATVRNDCGKWYVSLLVEVHESPNPNNTIVGLDRNVGNGATRDGALIPTPELRKRMKRLKRHQRIMQRRRKGSNRRKKAQRRWQKAWRAIRVFGRTGPIKRVDTLLIATVRRFRKT